MATATRSGAAAMEQLADETKAAVASAVGTQKEATSLLSEINSHWIARAKAETDEMNALVQKVADIKSPLDAMSLWQDWFERRARRASDDFRKFVEDSQSLMASMTKQPPKKH